MHTRAASIPAPGVARLDAGMLVNVNASDPLTFTAAELLLGAASLLASHVPGVPPG